MKDRQILFMRFMRGTDFVHEGQILFMRGTYLVHEGHILFMRETHLFHERDTSSS